MNFHNRRLRLAAGCLAACLLAAATAATAQAVGPASTRPAVATRDAAKAVLLAAARAGKRLVAVGERGIVVLSDDGGRTWRQAPVPVSETLTAVQFVDARTGFAVGHAGLVLATDDGGEHWTKRFDGVQASRLALQAAQASGDAARLREAERLVRDGADKPLLDLHFFDARRGLVVGAYDLVFATEDGGRTWQPWMDRMDNPKGLHLYVLRALGDTLLIAGEQGLVLRSADAGRSFKRLDTGYKGSFFTAELPAVSEILVAGLRGNVRRSTDGGATWSVVAVPAPVSFTASTLRVDGSVLLGNQAGALFREQGGEATSVGAPLPPIDGLLALGNEDGGHDGLLALTVKGAITVPAAALVPGAAQ